MSTLTSLFTRPDLPTRYHANEWSRPFDDAVRPALATNVRILDIGSGRKPALPPHRRPHPSTYFGFDLSLNELLAAPPNAYDKTFVGDVTSHQPALDKGFDLVLCWQVLEHVKPLDAALENIRGYLRPGGLFVGQLSGLFVPFALANRAIPHRLATVAMKMLLGRDPSSVFPAYYHKCWYDALVGMTTRWSSFAVVPRYTGATYLNFLPIAQRAYLAYEEWTIRHSHRNLASHYLLVGHR